jgi:hypothetical protein
VQVVLVRAFDFRGDDLADLQRAEAGEMTQDSAFVASVCRL